MVHYVYMLRVFLKGSKTHRGMKSFLYTGETTDIKRRLWEHYHGVRSAFLKQFYGGRSFKCVYVECVNSVWDGKKREKTIKGKSLAEREKLIGSSLNCWHPKEGAAGGTIVIPDSVVAPAFIKRVK